MRTRNLENHFVIENPTKPRNPSCESGLFHYTSDQELLSKHELESRLDALGIFKMEMKDFLGRNIEEIRDNL